MAIIDNISNYYKLDEASGTLVDSVGNQNGTAINTPTFGVAGIINDALDFERDTSQHVSLGTYDPFTTNVFTLSFWIKPESKAGLNMFLLSKRDSFSNSNMRWGIEYVSGVIAWRGDTSVSISSTQDITLGVWQHIVLVSDGTDTQLYYNGTSVHTGGTIVLGTDTTSAYRIGATQVGVATFDGIMDEVGVWSRRLSSSEITDLYNSGDGLSYPFVVGENYLRTYTESFSFSASPTKQSIKLLEDTTNLSDAKIFSMIRILSDTLNLSEDYSKVWTALRTYSESYSLADDYSKVLSLVREYSESFSFLEDLNIIFTKNLQGELFNFSEDITKLINKNVTESLSLSDGDFANITRILLETFNISDNYERVWDSVKTLTESFNLSDEDLKSIVKILSESFNASDSILKDFSRELNESISISDVVEIIKVSIKELTETISLSDTYSRVWDATPELSESYNLSDTYSKVWTILRTYSEAISMSDADVKNFSRSLVENFSLLDSFSKIIDLVRTYSETTNLSDNLLKDISREFSQSFSLSDSKINSITKILIENQSLSDSFSREWQTSRTYAETINLADSLEVVRTLIKELTESLSLDDGTVPFSFIKLLTESLNITDFFVNMVFDSIRMKSARTDIQSIIQEDGIQATLIRQTETTDTTGAVTDVSEQEYTIYMSIQDILREDRQIHDMGLAFPGSAKVFLFHEYPDSITGNGIVSVQVGDMIKDDEDKYWRVETINGEREMEGSEIFKSAIIKRVDLDQ